MIAVGVVSDRRPRRGRRRTARRSTRSSQETVQPVTILLLLRAFAAGAVALTGTEAIATGVPAFKPPEARNAATTLAVMAALLAVLFIGITFLAVNFAILPIEFPEKQTVISQVGTHRLRRRHRVLPVPGLHRDPAVPRREHQLQRVPAAPRDPRAATATCLASSRSAAIGSRSPTGSSSWPSLAALLVIVFRGVHPPADPALRGRRLHRLHHQPDRHDPPLAPRADAGWRRRLGDQRVRREPHRPWSP